MEKKIALCTSSVAYQGGRKPQFQINYDLVVRLQPECAMTIGGEELECGMTIGRKEPECGMKIGHEVQVQSRSAYNTMLVKGTLSYPTNRQTAVPLCRWLPWGSSPQPSACLASPTTAFS